MPSFKGTECKKKYFFPRRRKEKWQKQVGGRCFMNVRGAGGKQAGARQKFPGAEQRPEGIAMPLFRRERTEEKPEPEPKALFLVGI